MIDIKQKIYFEKKENRYNEQLLITPLQHVVAETGYILNELKKRNITEVVDFGSGNGRLTIPLMRESIKVTAVDISSKSLDSLIQSSSKMGLNKKLLNTSSDIPKKKWDAIVGCDILHHVPLNGTLQELRNALMDGTGVIIFSEPNIFNIAWSIFVTVRNTWKVEKGMIYCSYFNFYRELKNNKFRNIYLYGYGLFPPVLLNNFPYLQRINYFLGNLPVIKFFAYRFIIIAQANQSST